MGGQLLDKRDATRVSRLPQGQWPSALGSEPGNKQQTDSKPNWEAAALWSANDLSITNKINLIPLQFKIYSKLSYSQNLVIYFPCTE